MQNSAKYSEVNIGAIMCLTVRQVSRKARPSKMERRADIVLLSVMYKGLSELVGLTSYLNAYGLRYINGKAVIVHMRADQAPIHIAKTMAVEGAA